MMYCYLALEWPKTVLGAFFKRYNLFPPKIFKLQIKNPESDKLKNARIRGLKIEPTGDAFIAMSIALDTLGPALDAGLLAVKTLFTDSVKELKAMIIRKPVYVNHVDIWFLRSMDPLSRDPLKLRPLLKSLVRLPR